MHLPTDQPPAYVEEDGGVEVVPPPSELAEPEKGEKERGKARLERTETMPPGYEGEEGEKERSSVASTSRVVDLSIHSGGPTVHYITKDAVGTFQDVIVGTPDWRSIDYYLHYLDIGSANRWSQCILRSGWTSYEGGIVGTAEKPAGRSDRKLVRMGNGWETMLKQEGIIFKTTSAHDFKGADGSDFKWRKRFDDRMDWVLVKKLPNRQEHVVCEWKITRRCDGGNGRDGTLVINQDFVKQTELIILTGLLIMQWAVQLDGV